MFIYLRAPIEGSKLESMAILSIHLQKDDILNILRCLQNLTTLHLHAYVNK